MILFNYLGLDVPAETINLDASSKVISRYITSLFGNINKKMINVFVPTTPNPTSGFLLMYPKDEIIYLDMSFEEASKFIVSAGTSEPN
mgnify:CR=1 FL=1